MSYMVVHVFAQWHAEELVHSLALRTCRAVVHEDCFFVSEIVWLIIFLFGHWRRTGVI